MLVDPAQFGQSILNLVVNARDAMPDGGRLRLAASHLRLARGLRTPDIALERGDYVMVEVRDTGHGMDEETRAHVFEPFFTTKGPGVGTGLGLAMVYGFVHQSGGTMEVESRPGQGAAFRLYFPCTQATERTAPPPSLADRRLRGNETVLLVEDEAAVRALAKRVLESLGYAVVEAADGVQALDVARRHPGHLELLVTDVVMPRMGGEELAQTLLRNLPELRVLFVSGYPIGLRRPSADLAERCAFLDKPFRAADLAAKVRRLLDSREISGTFQLGT